MIYELERSIAHICKCIRHFFRKMFCKSYFYNDWGKCSDRFFEIGKYLSCCYEECPKLKSAQHWRYDEETAKEIEWLEALERKVRADKADRKTENSSEKPNNSTISKMEQVDEPKTQTETQNSNLTFEKADEPQSEQWHYDEKDNTWYPYQHKSCATCKHALGNWDGESNNCGRCCGADRRFYEPIEDEQTERSE